MRVPQRDEQLGALAGGRAGGQRRRQVLGRVGVGQRGRGLAGGRPRPAQEPVGGRQRPRLLQVRGDEPGRGGLRRLERVGQLQVQPRAARGGKRRQDGVGHERVREGEPVVGAADDETRPDRLVERVEQLRGRPGERGREVGEAEAQADRRGERERLARGGRQAGQAAVDHVADPGGRAPRGAPALALLAQQLPEEERVAARALAVARRRGDVTAMAGQQARPPPRRPARSGPRAPAARRGAARRASRRRTG